jgi:sterol 24-C-methyltransferase
LQYIRSLSNIYRIYRISRVGYSLVYRIIGVTEILGLTPSRTRKTTDSIAVATDYLVTGIKEDLFTLIYIIITRKPAATNK